VSESNRLECALRRAFTIVELLVIVAVVGVLLAALIPTVHRLRSDSGQIVSASNLQHLAFSHAMYSASSNGRQPTWVPDDLGLFGGNIQAYAATLGCPSQHILGFGANQGLWGYYLPCGVSTGNWGNVVFYQPNSLSSVGTGAFRSPGSQAFSTYVDGRYYSPLLYAPNDTATYGFASPMFGFQGQFTLLDAPSPAVVQSSYAFSPAGMWHPSVHGKNASTGQWWTNPTTTSVGFISPSYAQCQYPELKTLMIEHNWNLGQPGPINDGFTGGQTPYFFSHGIAASPLTLFHDGRVAELPNAQVAADDATVLAGTGGEVGLWTRDTPVGADGYYGSVSFDGFVTGHHVLTADGILGRDVLSTKPGGGVARAGARMIGADRSRPGSGSGSGAGVQPPSAGVAMQESSW